MERADLLTLAPLRSRFEQLWLRLGATGDPGPVFDDLVSAYSQPWRLYHGLEHLRDCLAQLDASPRAGAERDLAETALWFHDAVYDPRSADNESLSADLASRSLIEAGVAPQSAREVERLIRLTDHAAPARDPAGALVCDIDLSILGRPPDEFAEYERRVRGEYAWVSEPDYRRERAAVLSRFLARRPLYRSRHFRTIFEVPARRNLERSIRALSRHELE